MKAVDKGINKRIFSLIAVFLIGNLIIRFPKGEGQQHSFWGYIICFAGSTALICFISNLHYVTQDFGIQIFDKSVNNVIIKNALKILLMFFVLICLIICCKDYTVMLGEIRLRGTPKWILAAVYIITVLLLALTKKHVIYYFSFTNIILVAIGIIVMFLFSISSFDISYLYKSFSFDAKNALNQGLTFYIHSFGQVILCMLFIGHIKKQDKKANIPFGVLLGGVLFLICFLNVILMMGNDIIDELHFPYATATSMLVSNDGYNRMDVITYYIYFICNLIKSAVLFKILIELCKNKMQKYIVVFIALFLSVIFSSNSGLSELLQSKTVNFILLCLEVFFPIVIGILTYKKRFKGYSH